MTDGDNQRDDLEAGDHDDEQGAEASNKPTRTGDAEMNNEERDTQPQQSAENDGEEQRWRARRQERLEKLETVGDADKREEIIEEIKQIEDYLLAKDYINESHQIETFPSPEGTKSTEQLEGAEPSGPGNADDEQKKTGGYVPEGTDTPKTEGREDASNTTREAGTRSEGSEAQIGNQKKDERQKKGGEGQRTDSDASSRDDSVVKRKPVGEPEGGEEETPDNSNKDAGQTEDDPNFEAREPEKTDEENITNPNPTKSEGSPKDAEGQQPHEPDSKNAEETDPNGVQDDAGETDDVTDRGTEDSVTNQKPDDETNRVPETDAESEAPPVEQSDKDQDNEEDGTSKGEYDEGGDTQQQYVTQAEYNELQEELEDLKKYVEEYKRKNERDKDEIKKYAVFEFAQNLLNVRETLVRTVNLLEDQDANYTEQIRGIQKQFDKRFTDGNIETIEPEPGTMVDPTYHESVEKEPSNQYDSGSVVRVKEKGFKLFDRVLKTAEVVEAS